MVSMKPVVVLVAVLACVGVGSATSQSSSSPSSNSLSVNAVYGCPSTYLVQSSDHYYDVSALTLPTGKAYTYISQATNNQPVYTYTVNPCGIVACPDSQMPTVTDAVGCQVYNSYNATTNLPIPHERIIGVSSQAIISESQTGPLNGLTMQFFGGTPCRTGENRTTIVHVLCDTAVRQPVLDFTGETSKCLYEFTLRAYKGGCPIPIGKAGPSPGEQVSHFLASHHASAGTVICIISAVSIAVYLLAGVTYKGLVLGARGTEAIPNIGFWRDLPGLVSDGLVYTFSLHKKKGTSTYDAL